MSGIRRNLDITNQEICDMYTNDPKMTIRGLAKKIKLSPTAITKVLVDNNISIRSVTLRNVAITEQEVCDLYTSNPEISVAELSKRTGLSDSTIYNVLKKNNIDTRSAALFKKADITDKQLCAIYANDPKMTLRELSRQTGLGRQYIKTTLRANGLELRYVRLSKEQTIEIVAFFNKEKNNKPLEEIIEILSKRYDRDIQDICTSLRNKGIHLPP